MNENTAREMDFTQEITLTDEKASIIAQANEIKIVTTDDYMKAKSVWGAIKMLRGKIKDTFQPMIDQAHRLHKETIARRDGFDAPLATAEKTAKAAMEEFDRIQAQKRREEEARLRELARKQEEDRRLEEAAALERMGMKDQANQILDAPVNVPAPALPKQEREAGDPVFRTAWKFRITSPVLVPNEYKKIDEVAIGLVVRALKDKTNIPGVEVYSERV